MIHLVSGRSRAHNPIGNFNPCCRKLADFLRSIRDVSAWARNVGARTKVLAFLMVTAVLGLGIRLPAAHAGPIYWIATGTGVHNWSVTSNWFGGTLVTGDAIVYNGTSGTNSYNNLSGLNIAGITFGPSAGPYTLNGNAINLTGNITNNSPTPETVNLPIALPQNVALSGDLSFGGVISGTGGLTDYGWRLILNVCEHLQRGHDLGTDGRHRCVHDLLQHAGWVLARSLLLRLRNCRRVWQARLPTI